MLFCLLLLLDGFITSFTRKPMFILPNATPDGIEPYPNDSSYTNLPNYTSVPERILTPERQRLREARLTLDFSLLTAENCDATEELHAKNITKINDAWEGLQEDLDKQEEKAGKLSDELRMETQGSARWESLKKDYDALQEEIDDIEDRLEELERLHGNMAFTLHEMEEECLMLKKHNP